MLILAFVGLNFRPAPDAFKSGGAISTFDVAADSGAAERVDSPNPTTPDDAAPRPTPEIPKPKIVLPEREIDLPFIPMDRATMRSGNIAALGSNAPGYVAATKGGAAPGDSEMVGTAPNGEPLYAAEWYREPTDTELAGYLPKNMPEGGGSGLVACRTVAGYRVEDCIELQSIPGGSRLAGAVRQAAWQFRVRPPRVGGKPLFGTWVRIRIDYLRGEEGR